MLLCGYTSFCLGILFERRFVGFEVQGSLAKKLLRFFLGIFLLVLLYVGLKLLPLQATLRNSLRYSCVVFTAIGVYPWLFKKINL